MKHATKAPEYWLNPRRIVGSHEQKLEQIDSAIQELLDLKLLECADEQPNVRFIAAPRPESHWFIMTVTILILLIVLTVLLSTRSV